MTLRAFLVADPLPAVSELLVAQCQRLAQTAHSVASCDALLAAAEAHRPEVLICSLELVQPQASRMWPRLRQLLPNSLLMASYRELSVGQMGKLQQMGVADFLPQPIDPTQVFRAVATRFAVAVRQHPRFAVQLEVHRADGLLLGRTRNVSMGGLSFVGRTQTQAGEAMLLRLALGPHTPTIVRLRVLACIAEPDGAYVIRGQFDNLRGPSLQQLAAFLGQLTEPT